jgi:hypothetical protein
MLNIHKFYVLPTQCIYVFCVDLRTNSDYFPIQYLLDFITEMEYVYCAVRAGSLNIAQVNLHLHVTLNQDKWAKPGKLFESNAPSTVLSRSI